MTKDIIAKRAVEACKIKVNDCMERVFPELIPEAVKIIQSEDTIIQRHPEHKAKIQELCQLKLDTLALRHIMDEIRFKREAGKKLANLEVKKWAKTQKFGPYLNKAGILDPKLMRREFATKGKSWMAEIVEDYNRNLVPYANQKLAELGGEYTAEEKQQGLVLNQMLLKHNDLVKQLGKIVA